MVAYNKNDPKYNQWYRKLYWWIEREKTFVMMFIMILTLAASILTPFIANATLHNNNDGSYTWNLQDSTGTQDVYITFGPNGIERKQYDFTLGTPSNTTYTKTIDGSWAYYSFSNGTGFSVSPTNGFWAEELFWDQGYFGQNIELTEGYNIGITNTAPLVNTTNTVLNYSLNTIIQNITGDTLTIDNSKYSNKQTATGKAALIWSKFPNLNGEQVDEIMTKKSVVLPWNRKLLVKLHETLSPIGQLN